MQKLLSFCEKNEIKYEMGLMASDFSSFKIGGRIPVVIYPSSTEKVAETVRFMNENNIRFFPFGKCSNVLFPDTNIDFVFLKTDLLSSLSIADDHLICGAGVSISKAAYFAQKNGLSGMEGLYGIPGSVGGGVYMNAGAYGFEVSQLALETEFVSQKGEIGMIVGAEHQFGYRKSVFQEKNFIVTKTKFKLTKDEPLLILNRMTDFMNRRKASQPLEYPSAGSIFKRPEGYFAGKLIEDSGLKGLTVGGACVSEKHAGFIINKGGATAEDVKNLIKEITCVVQKKYAVTLETEIKIY